MSADTAELNRGHVEDEKRRVYAPINRKDGIDWKELNTGICRIMQDYCGDIKNGELLNIGLKWFMELRDSEAQTVWARNPHELMRTLETLNMIDNGEAVMHACLARKAGSVWLGFERIDYPETDPPDWNKWITVRFEDGNVKTGERPLHYWGDLESSYEKHCGLQGGN